MTHDDVKTLLHSLRSAKEELDIANCKYRDIQSQLEDLIINFPKESVIRFVAKNKYNPGINYLYNNAKITPLIKGGYNIEVWDEFRGETDLIGEVDVSEEELVEFLFKNNEWLEHKKSEEEKLRLEQKKKEEKENEEHERKEYERLKKKFERRVSYVN